MYGKLKIIYLTFFVLLNTLAYSQKIVGKKLEDTKPNNFDFGIQAGFSLNYLEHNLFLRETKLEAQGNLIGLNVRKNLIGNLDLISSLSFMYYEMEFETVAPPCCGFDEVGNGFIDAIRREFQLSLLGSYRLINDNLSLEFGPSLGYSKGFDFKNDVGPTLWNGGLDFYAIDLENIRPLNLSLQFGASVGFDKLKITVQYQLGVTNVFRGVDFKNRPDEDLKGHTSTVLLMTIWYF